MYVVCSKCRHAGVVVAMATVATMASSAALKSGMSEFSLQTFFPTKTSTDNKLRLCTDKHNTAYKYQDKEY